MDGRQRLRIYAIDNFICVCLYARRYLHIWRQHVIFALLAWNGKSAENEDRTLRLYFGQREKADKIATAAHAGRRIRSDESDSLSTHRTCGTTQQITILKLGSCFQQEILLDLVKWLGILIICQHVTVSMLFV